MLLLGQISLLLALGSYSSWLIDRFSLPRRRCVCNTDGARSTLLSQPDLAAVSFPLTRKLTLLIALHPTNPARAGRELRDPWEALGTSVF